MNRLLALTTAALLLSTAQAQTTEKVSTPIGLWRTIDDMTGQPRGIVRVYHAYFGERDRPFRRIVTEALWAGISPVPAT